MVPHDLTKEERKRESILLKERCCLMNNGINRQHIKIHNKLFISGKIHGEALLDGFSVIGNPVPSLNIDVLTPSAESNSTETINSGSSNNPVPSSLHANVHKPLSLSCPPSFRSTTHTNWLMTTLKYWLPCIWLMTALKFWLPWTPEASCLKWMIYEPIVTPRILIVLALLNPGFMMIKRAMIQKQDFCRWFAIED